MKAPGISVILAVWIALWVSATGAIPAWLALLSWTVERAAVDPAVKTSKSLSTRDAVPRARLKTCPLLTVAMILMLDLSALREISAFPCPSLVEHTDYGAGQAALSHP